MAQDVTATLYVLASHSELLTVIAPENYQRSIVCTLGLYSVTYGPQAHSRDPQFAIVSGSMLLCDSVATGPKILVCQSWTEES